MNKPVDDHANVSGGELVGEVLAAHGVKTLFTLCGGHISPILVGAKRREIAVVDVRHEVDAVFAADAMARLTGTPGVAAVTAGPGVTNTITAIKNAQLAQSPVVLLGGATATVLKGRGALQDIDQLALFRPHVKWAVSIDRIRDLVPSLKQAFRIAAEGTPGPVFVELPVDLLYRESIVREWYMAQGGTTAQSLAARALNWYLNRHLGQVFARTPPLAAVGSVDRPTPPAPENAAIKDAAHRLAKAERPLLLIGSQATLLADELPALIGAVETLGIPVYSSGMARGLLGSDHPLLMRHQRGKALRQADVVVLAGVPCDFRLNYGRHIPPKCTVIAANRSPEDLRKNRRPETAALGDPALFLRALATACPSHPAWDGWLDTLRKRDDERNESIAEQATAETEFVNPLALCQAIDQALDDDSVLVADGGDFVATASYIARPRRPLSWLDPGVFGTLGVGGGFALGAKMARPSAEVWVLYGDGSAAYSLAEFDTFVRLGLPVIAVVGNDACWSQIARDQIEILGDDVGTVLRRTAYHEVAQGYGGRGLMVDRPEDVEATLQEAKAIARAGTPVLVNAWIGKTDFRKGSISM